MLAKLRRLAPIAALLTMGAAMAFAQTATLEGDVKGPDGKPLKDAIIQITRKDQKGNYKTKSDKKGHFVHAGLPSSATYDIECIVDGKTQDKLNNFRLVYDSKPISFDLEAVAKQQQALQQAASTGQVSEEITKSLSKEEKEKLEAQLKEREKQLKSNKELQDAFNAGKQAYVAKDYKTAEEAFEKAAVLDPKQVAVWASLADTYAADARTKSTPDEKKPLQEKATEAYTKTIELQDDAATRNNLALLYGELGKYPEMQAALQKAAELDPPQAGKYYFNAGAILFNASAQKPELAPLALEAFKKVPDTDEQYYANSQFQAGVIMLRDAREETKDGVTKVIPAPGTVELFQNYLAKQPEGPHSAEAKAFLQTFGEGITAKYTDPNAKINAPKASKPAVKKK